MSRDDVVHKATRLCGLLVRDKLPTSQMAWRMPDQEIRFDMSIKYPISAYNNTEASDGEINDGGTVSVAEIRWFTISRPTRVYRAFKDRDFTGCDSPFQYNPHATWTDLRPSFLAQ